MIKTNPILSILLILLVLLIPHFAYMAAWEFLTWGDAVWDMGEWTSIRRSGWLIYETLLVIGILTFEWR